MRYLLLICEDESAAARRSPQDQQANMAAYLAFGQEFKERIQAGEALQPTTTATTVRVREGKTLATDGPFAETKEQLGGYYLVQCDNLDQAIEIAAHLPAASDGSVEVRPIMEFE
jgi:hypothetical protein